MINSDSIAFDINGVVADTMSLFFEIIKKRLKNKIMVKYGFSWNYYPCSEK